MSDEVDNLILAQLRAIREDMGEMRKDISDIKSDMSDIDQKVDGLTVMFAMLAGHVHSIEERVEALEGGDSE